MKFKRDTLSNENSLVQHRISLWDAVHRKRTGGVRKYRRTEDATGKAERLLTWQVLSYETASVSGDHTTKAEGINSMRLQSQP
jgi:hypothetical protein